MPSYLNNLTDLKICQKRRYPDKADALEMIRILVRLRKADDRTLSAYACRICHHWHLTSRNNK